MQRQPSWCTSAPHQSTAPPGRTALSRGDFILPHIMSGLKNYIITLKDSATSVDVDSLKKKVKDFGGEITNEFSLIKGFSAKLPAVHSKLLEDHEHVSSIEEDKEVHTQ